MDRLKQYLNGPWAKSYDPMALAKMKADTANAIPGTLTGYECGLCRNRGNITVVTEDARIVSRPCRCMPVRRCLWEIRRSGMQAVLESCSFDSFRADAPWQRTLLQSCRGYALKPEGWLVLCGQSGCGKTHLCSAVCHSLLMAGRQVRYLSWREFTVQIKGLTADYDRQQAVLEPYKQIQVLYIDDLFKCGGAPTAADISLAFELVNYRYNNRLTTIISTEYTPRELAKLDEATGSRIIEMAGESLLVIPRDTSRNYRLRSAKPSN